jgi:hypothetical protein
LRNHRGGQCPRGKIGSQFKELPLLGVSHSREKTQEHRQWECSKALRLIQRPDPAAKLLDASEKSLVIVVFRYPGNEILGKPRHFPRLVERSGGRGIRGFGVLHHEINHAVSGEKRHGLEHAVSVHGLPPIPDDGGYRSIRLRA